MMVRRRYGSHTFGAALLAAAIVGLTAMPATAAPPGTVDMRAAIDGTPTVVAGEMLHVQVGTIVPGPPTPTGVTMTVTLPENVTYEGGGSGGGSGPCRGEIGGRVVVCIPDPEEPTQGGRQWQVAGRAAKSLAIGTELTTTAVVSSDSTESNPADNTAVLVTRVVEHPATYVEVTGPTEPVVPGRPFRVSMRVHYDDGPPIENLLVFASFDEWFSRGRIVNVPADCSAEPYTVMCETDQRLVAGTDLTFEYEFGTNTDPDNYPKLAFTQGFWIEVAGQNVSASTLIRFTQRPSAPPSPSPSSSSPSPSSSPSRSSSPTPSHSPTPRPGDQAQGGLPITGTATAPLVAAGTLLVVAGAGAVLLTRRRRH
jgi:LPXTG-motif cell wall-anchored protein